MSESTEDKNIDGSNDEPKNDQSASKAKNKKYSDDPTKIHIETNPVEIITGTAGFLRSILSLRNIKYDHDTVITSVKEGIEFKGYNVWILMCSILIASVGLNVDSTAVIIGAMLISPLMGPIKGIGFGVGTNDFRMLLDSLKNLGITVGISLLVAFLYFLISPIHEENSNLLSRTSPTFLDVVIAIFGGLAGVIAHTQGKNDTVIPGVAIATALMPPLCTAGYGLAIGNWGYFFGASYLFLLNSLLIAASAYFFIRYLKFPKKEYLTPKIDKRVRVYTWVFIIVAVAPSGYLFYEMTKRSIFEGNTHEFVEKVIRPTNDNMIIEELPVFDWDESYVMLEITNFHADDAQVEIWNKSKVNYGLGGVDLRIKQDENPETIFTNLLDEYGKNNKGANKLAELLEKTMFKLERSERLIDELNTQKENATKTMQFDHLLAGFKIDYPEYKHIYINESYTLNSENVMDTLYLMSVEFDESIQSDKRENLNSRLSQRLKLELNQKAGIVQDSIRVISMN